MKSLKVPTEEQQSRQFKVQGSRFKVTRITTNYHKFYTLRVEIYETTADAGNQLNIFSRLTQISTNFHKFLYASRRNL